MATFRSSMFRTSPVGILNFPIEMDVTGFRMNANQIRESTFRLARQFGDMRWPLETSVKLVVIPSMMRNFIEGGRPFWPVLAEDTIIYKIKHFPNQNAFIPLWRTGELHRVVEAGRYWRITRDSADMNQLDRIVAYAKYHQAGTRHMPQRQFALLQEFDIAKIVRVFEQWINAQMHQKDMWPYKFNEF